MSTLYETDILQWVEETVTQLKTKDFEHLDLEHLIEEVEALGISQKRELVNRLMVLLAHLLKRLYVDLPQDYRGWEVTIRDQRLELEFLLEDTPSLKSHWDSSVAKAWQRALRKVRQGYPDTDFPDRWPYDTDMETMLTVSFW